jgi:formyltetrahydrofolate synthetase
VATVRALKMHGGAFKNIRTEKAKVEQENVEAVRTGCANLEKHIENLLLLGLPVVVAINRFPSDTKAEIAAIQERALAAGAKEAVPHEGVLRGGEGAVALAEAVVRHSAEPAPMKFLYETSLSIEEKIRVVATKMYGAGSIELSPKVKRRIAFFEKAGLGGLPICVAKTPASLSHDPKLLNRPSGFKFPITDILAAAGAGFVYPMAGEIMMMPGLPADPAAAHIDIDERGHISGIT